MSNAAFTSRASRELIVRLGKTLKGNADLFDDVFVDPLHPQLLNRKAFDRIYDDAELSGMVRSVTYADADGLKRLNDTQGHDTGDEFLRDIVETWTLAVRSWDRADSLIFRLGGDEFVVLWFQDGQAGSIRLGDAWNARFYGDDDRGVTQAWARVDADWPLADALEAAEDNVSEAKAGRARTEVETLRARVAELEAQVERLRERATVEGDLRREAQAEVEALIAQREEDARAKIEARKPTAEEVQP